MSRRKQVILAALSLMTGVVLYFSSLKAQGPYPDNVVFYNYACGVTNLAANSTNTVTGFNYPTANVSRGLSIFVSAMTYTNAGNLKVFFQLSPDGSSYTTPVYSPVFIQLTPTNSSATVVATNIVWDWFNLPGNARLREARVENNMGTSVSNLQVIFSYPFDANNQNR